jgi:hypothetical protein
MKLDIPDDYLPLVVTALDHYYAYTKAVHREESRYQEAADWFRVRLPKEDEAEVKPRRRK